MLAMLLPVVNTKSRRMAQVWPKCFYATSVAMAAKAAQNIAALNCAPGQLLLGSQYLLGTLALRSDGKNSQKNNTHHTQHQPQRRFSEGL